MRRRWCSLGRLITLSVRWLKQRLSQALPEEEENAFRTPSYSFHFPNVAFPLAFQTRPAFLPHHPTGGVRQRMVGSVPAKGDSLWKSASTVVRTTFCMSTTDRSAEPVTSQTVTAKIKAQPSSRRKGKLRNVEYLDSDGLQPDSAATNPDPRIALRYNGRSVR